MMKFFGKVKGVENCICPSILVLKSKRGDWKWFGIVSFSGVHDH